MKTTLSKLIAASVLSTAVFASPAFAMDDQKITIHHMDNSDRSTVAIRVVNAYDNKLRVLARGDKQTVKLATFQNEYRKYKVYRSRQEDTPICTFVLSTSDAERWIKDISPDCQVSLKEDGKDGNYIQQKRGYKKDHISQIDKSLELYWPKQH